MPATPRYRSDETLRIRSRLPAMPRRRPARSSSCNCCPHIRVGTASGRRLYSAARAVLARYGDCEPMRPCQGPACRTASKANFVMVNTAPNYTLTQLATPNFDHAIVYVRSWINISTPRRRRWRSAPCPGRSAASPPEYRQGPPDPGGRRPSGSSSHPTPIMCSPPMADARPGASCPASEWARHSDANTPGSSSEPTDSARPRACSKVPVCAGPATTRSRTRARCPTNTTSPRPLRSRRSISAKREIFACWHGPIRGLRSRP